MIQHPLVLVKWDDAWSDSNTFSTLHGVQQTHQAMQVQTLGWLLHDDPAGISLANERSTEDGQDSYRGRTFVPRAMVRTVTRFTMTKPRKPAVTKEEI